MFLLCIRGRRVGWGGSGVRWGKSTFLTVNSVDWMFLMFLTEKKASLRSYVNASCSFPLESFQELLRRVKLKKTWNKPHVSAQCFFITWDRGIWGALIFCIQHLPTAGTRMFFQTCQYKLKFALKVIWSKCLGTLQGLPHSHYVHDSGKNMERISSRKDVSGW